MSEINKHNLQRFSPFFWTQCCSQPKNSNWRISLLNYYISLWRHISSRGLILGGHLLFFMDVLFFGVDWVGEVGRLEYV